MSVRSVKGVARKILLAMKALISGNGLMVPSSFIVPLLFVKPNARALMILTVFIGTIAL